MAEQPISIPVRKSVFTSGFRSYLMRVWYAVRARYRQLRISKTATELLGPQYRRSRDRIEIDITYVCNLRCLNCNRSITQAPEKLHISLTTIKSFVSESIARNKRWKAIRVLGGEPTLHPEFQQIIEALLEYRRWEPGCSIQVVSNGHGKAVNAILNKLPAEVMIENTSKTGNLQPGFGAFNLAPADDPAFREANFRNGCDVMERCGMGLTPLGYYPCAVAGGIDRIAGGGLGYGSLPPDDDDMVAVSEKLCRLCGHFRDGHQVPQQLRPPLLKEEMSRTWIKLYDERKSIKQRRHANATVTSPASDRRSEEVCE